MFHTFEMFCQTMDACTENFECLVIHNGAKSNKLEDCVFWYKADPKQIKNFRFGSSNFWEFHEDRYDPSTADNL